MLRTRQLYKSISVLLVVVLIIGMFSGCDFSSKHLETGYEENNNDDINTWDNVEGGNVTDWDNANIQSWKDVDDYSDWVYSEVLFNDFVEDMPVVECRVLDYRSNGKYFDGERVYRLVGDAFDINTFLAKYATGTGVIVICVILKIATIGTPVACFFAGAADGSIAMATKGFAFGAATKAVLTAIQSNGDFEETLYGALEGSADGYMWGAIYGAITGGFSSEFCFTENTMVLTERGTVQIDSVSVGDIVCSYDENSESYGYKKITQVIVGETDTITEVTVCGNTIQSTPGHPYLTADGWREASELSAGDKVVDNNGGLLTIDGVHTFQLEHPVATYNLCVEDNHTYIVGNPGVIVHNKCKPNEKYAGKTYHFPEGSAQAAKYPNGVPFDLNGYPRFEQYAEKIAKFDFPSVEARNAGKCLIGNCSSDFAMANAQVGLSSVPAGFTWHHCEDMQTMLLVPQDLHSVAFGGAAHAGGESLLKELWATLLSIAN